MRKCCIRELNRKRKAFSLVEVAVVTAIIGVLAAIVFPVVARSKRSSYESVNISNLKQLAVAASLYTNEYQSLPLCVKDLYVARLIDPKICSSQLDRYARGVQNEFTARYSKGIASVPFKSSFVGLRDLNVGGNRLSEFLDGRSGGWLVDLTVGREYQPLEGIVLNNFGAWEGKFHRLLFDGSVVTKRHQPEFEMISGQRARTFDMFDWFRDEAK